MKKLPLPLPPPLKNSKNFFLFDDICIKKNSRTLFYDLESLVTSLLVFLLNRLRLSDILVIPMQRLTKYGLLLKAVHRNTDNEHELAMLNEMVIACNYSIRYLKKLQLKIICLKIRCVDNFVHSVNLNLKQKQDIDRLQTVISRIEGYEAMVSDKRTFCR